MELYNEGYVMDIPYNDYYFRELSPLYLRTLATLRGAHLSDNTPLRYLELGYGQGSSLCIHAAANEGEFWGTDFNPEHSITAQHMAQCCTKTVHILNDSFEDLAEKSRHGLLPTFDVIVMHGIWSWVSKENHAFIMEIIRKNLKVGGLVYVGYNAMPGWASLVPLHDFFIHHANSQGSAQQDTRSKVAEAIRAFTHLEQEGALYTKKHSAVAKYFKALCTHDATYIAHEHFNQQWNPVYFKDMAAYFFDARCTFLTTAHPVSQLKGSIPQSLEEAFASIDDIIHQETLRDYAQDTMFRKDIFIKGHSALSLQQHARAVRALRFVLTCQEKDVSYELGTPFGIAQADSAIYKGMIAFLAQENYRPKSLQEIGESPAFVDTPLDTLIQILLFFMSSGALAPAHTYTEAQETDCARLNTFICQKSVLNSPLPYLASPVTGSAVPVTQAEQMFLLAMALGHTKQNQCVAYVYKTLLEKDNLKKAPSNEQELLLEIKQWAKTFFEERLSFLTTLQIRVKAEFIQ